MANFECKGFLPLPSTLTLYPFIYHFSRKRYPFRIPSINKWQPFHIQNFASLLTAVNVLSFRQELITKIKGFLDFLKPQNSSVSPLSPFTDQMADFPTLSYASTSKIPTLSYSRSLKKIPLSAGAFPYRPSQGVDHHEQ